MSKKNKKEDPYGETRRNIPRVGWPIKKKTTYDRNQDKRELEEEIEEYLKEAGREENER